MKKQIKILKRYHDCSLYTKINIIVCCFTIVMTIAIVLLSTLYYNQVVRNQAIKNARSSTQTATTTISDNYNDIINRVIDICCTSSFVSDITAIKQSSVSHLTARNLVQDELTVLSECNYLVDNALIITSTNSSPLSLYGNPLNSSLLPFISESELTSMYRISWLSERTAPFFSEKAIIPLTFCITLNNGITRLSHTPTETVWAYVVIMLDSSVLSRIITISDKYDNSSALLATTSGELLYTNDLSLPSDLLKDSATLEFLSSIPNSSSDSFVFHSDSYSLIGSKITNSDVLVITYVEEKSFGVLLKDTSSLILTIFGVVLFILLIISVFVKNYISRPVRKLVSVVTQIKNGSYNKHVKFASYDEIGTLCRAINTMHDTIQEQMVQIKAEEAEKYSAQMQLLAEQINPHFLYNTLDCIQYEVKCGNTQVVSSMIQYLAEYLRIGLSFGSDLITVANELKHVHGYIKIMNQRFQQSITFMYRVDPELEQQMIPKMILQPLAENAIQHGFHIDHTGAPIFLPTIEALIQREGDQLLIKMVDNGAGFDVKQAEEILYHNADGHIGLHNVYLRLVAYYGKENVRCILESIPYYQNTISFYVPFKPHQDNPDSK